MPKAPRVSTPSTVSTVSISELLDYVNKYFPEILPEDVLKHYGYDSRPEGTPKELGESALYSNRTGSATDSRTLLANAFEWVAFDSNQLKDTANINPTENKDIRYSGRGNWHTGMTSAEVIRIEQLAKHELNSTDNYIDKGNKWLYNKKSGISYFAIYSTEDKENPTILYASKGNKADREYQWLIANISIIKEVNSNANKPRTVDQILGGVQNGNHRNTSNIRNAMAGRSNNGNAGVYSKTSSGKPSQALINCLRDIIEVSHGGRGVKPSNRTGFDIAALLKNVYSYILSGDDVTDE